MNDMAILLLAAGASSRMRGRDKLLEPVAGQPLLRRQARAALKTGARVLVTLPPKAPDRRAALADLPVEIVAVPDADSGMAASFRAAVAACGDTVAGLMIVPADMPDLGTPDFMTVFKDFDGQTILRGAAGDTPGHPVLFPRRYFSQLAALTGDEGARRVLRSNPVRLIPLPDQRALTDLDTPEAWDAWHLAQQSGAAT